MVKIRSFIIFFSVLQCVIYCAPDKKRCLGFCTKAQDCPVKPEAGLCPNQTDICCYGYPLSETRCQKRGGECMDSCPDSLTDTRAVDCPSGQFCCVLVH